MYSLAAHSTSSSSRSWVSEGQQQHPTSSSPSSSSGAFKFANLRESYRRSKSRDRTTAASDIPTIESYRSSRSRQKTTAESKSKDSNRSSSVSNKPVSRDTNIGCSINGINGIPSSKIESITKNGNIKTVRIKNKTYTIHKIVLGQTSSLDTTSSSLDEDEDLYDFDINEDERRHRPILKRTSKYGPLPESSSPKSRGFWWFFESYRKPQVCGNPTQVGGSGMSDSSESAGSSRSKSQVNRGESLVLGSPRLKHLQDDACSDQGYSSDEGSKRDKDLINLTQSMEEEKKKQVNFTDPLVTHTYRLTYKTYLPRREAIYY